MLAVIHATFCVSVSFACPEFAEACNSQWPEPELRIDRGHAAQVPVSARVFGDVSRWSVRLAGRVILASEADGWG